MSLLALHCFRFVIDSYSCSSDILVTDSIFEFLRSYDRTRCIVHRPWYANHGANPLPHFRQPNGPLAYPKGACHYMFYLEGMKPLG